MIARDLVKGGLFASLRPQASVKESLGIPGTPAAERLLTARMFESLEFEVLPGRGFDIGDTWYRGTPLSWFSPVSDARALPSPSGTEWLSRFTGGLLTTCGFGTIGEAGNGEGMHGRANHLPAHQVSWRVTDHSITLDAVIESTSLFDPSFEVRRRYRATTDDGGTARLRVTDLVTNIGPEAAGLSMLYHLNFGAPLVAPDSRVVIASEDVAATAPHPEVPDWSVLPTPTSHLAEAVFEHRDVSHNDDGFARAVILSSVKDLAVAIDWSASTLPHLHQWVFPTRGRWALGIEPATAPLFGPRRAGEHAGAPVIAPGESRVHEVHITIGRHETIL